MRYGDLFHKTDAFKEKRCSVMTLRYGMQYQQTAEFKKRRLMSLKDNGNYNGSSKGELRCLQLLRLAFGEVKHHIIVNG